MQVHHMPSSKMYSVFVAGALAVSALFVDWYTVLLVHGTTSQLFGAQGNSGQVVRSSNHDVRKPWVVPLKGLDSSPLEKWSSKCHKGRHLLGGCQLHVNP